MNKIVKSLSGNTIVSPTARIVIKGPDGKPISISVKDANKFAGQTDVEYEKGYINKDSDEIEREMITKIKTGPFKVARDQLFGEGRVSHFNKALNNYFHLSSFPTQSSFANYIQEEMESSAHDLGFIAVKPSTVLSWIHTEERIGPQDWRNFKGLSKAAEDIISKADKSKLEELVKTGLFHRSYNDLETFKEWQLDTDGIIKPTYEDNRYVANLLFKTAKIYFGKGGLGDSTKKKNESSPTESKPTGLKGDLASIRNDLGLLYADDVTTKTFWTPFFGVEEFDPKKHLKRGKGKKPRSEFKLRRGVKVVEDEELVKTYTKPLDEICQETHILERSIVHFARDTLYNYIKKMKDYSKDEVFFVMKVLEENIVHPRVIRKIKEEIGNSRLNKSKEKDLRNLANEFMNYLSSSKDQDEKINAFQKLHNAYIQLYSAFPRRFDDVAYWAARFTYFDNGEINNRNQKKYIQKEKNKALKILKTFKKNGITDEINSLFKKLPSDEMDARLTKGYATIDILTPIQIFDLLGLQPTIKNIYQIKNEFYTLNDIKKTLTKYEGESLIDSNIDIMVLKTLNNFNPNDTMRNQSSFAEDMLNQPKKVNIIYINAKKS